MKMHIVLSSGATFAVDVKEFTSRTDRLSGRLETLKWANQEDGTLDLHYLRLADVVAVWVDRG